MLRLRLVHVRFVAVSALTFLLAACGSSGDDSGSGGSGGAAAGSSGKGGSAGKGGTSNNSAGNGGHANGGEAGTATAGSAGSTATAGSAGTSATAGSGGETSAGGSAGSSGSGGETSTGGSAGSSAGGGGAGGSAGNANTAGASGTSGNGGASAGTGGASGSAGSAGTSGAAGASGSAGASGGTGTAGAGGTVGTAGATGTAGSGGASGAAGGTTSGGSGGATGGAGGASGASGSAGSAGAGGGSGSTSTFAGTGADGDLTVSGAMNLAVDHSGTRTCADAVSYSVVALSASGATVDVAPDAGCLASGDEVLLINLQGTADHFGNVGNYETLKVSTVSSTGITFTTNKTRFYGDGASDDSNLGLARTNQRVILQRVPNYNNVTVGGAGALTSSAWNGIKGGVMFFRAAGAVNITGLVSMAGNGYDGGPNITTVNTTGTEGESYAGLGASVAVATTGGGGGGIGDSSGCDSNGTGAAGGGYGTVGALSKHPVCGPTGGLVYGEATLLTKLMLGSGGGSGGTDNVLSDNPPGGRGGRGGGILFIGANQITVHNNASISANGTDGQGDTNPASCATNSTTDCYDYSGPGGGGSGGSVLLKAGAATLGTSIVTASGGLGGIATPQGAAYDAGNGGDGRVAVHSDTTLSGTTAPTATVD